MRRTETVQDAELIVQKIPSDLGIHRNPRKGTMNAPSKILENTNTSRKILVDEIFPDEFDLEETHRRIRQNTETLLEYEKPVITLGGDHSISFEVIRALKKENQDLELVWLDSHLDVKEKVEDNVSHDVVVRELVNKTSFEPDEIHFIGITRVDGDEESFIDGKQFNIVRPEDAIDYASSLDSEVYVSTDIDVLKENQAPGTGYPDGKMSVEEVLEVLKHLEFDFGDVVEVAPPFDRNNTTLENASSILELMAKRVVERQTHNR